MTVPIVELSGEALLGVGDHPLRGVAGELPPERVRLGRLKPKARPQALRLSAYLGQMRAAPPVKVDYSAKAASSLSRMYLNDQLGCCVISGKMHKLGIWSGNDSDSGGVVLATDQEVYNQYQAICGPGDNGCYIDRVLDVMRSKGLQAGGKTYTIDGYVEADWTSRLETMVAIYLFGSVTIGFDLPEAWLSSAVWDVTNSRIVGGHDVCAVGYDDTGVYLSSWGKVYRMTWPAWTSRRWIGECYAVLAPLWYGGDKVAPMGFNADKLRADLSKIGGGVIPDTDPVVPPAPPPSPPVPPVVPPPPPPPAVTGFTGVLQYHDGVLVGSVRDENVPALAGIEFARMVDRLGPIPPELRDLLVRNLKVALPVVLVGIVTGRSWQQIVSDVLAALAAQ